jgi:hypothetical protein
MKRALWTVAIFLGLLFVTDEVRSQLQRYVHEIRIAGLGTDAWLNAGDNLLFADVGIYAIVFAVAGAVIAWRAPSASWGVSFALLLGLAVSAITLAFNPPQPFYLSTYMPWWIELLSWANWYMPPIAAALGAFTWNIVASRGRHVRNDA